MTSPLKVACIIPTYNGRHELERLLDSLGRQSAEFDTFIVDSSSRDGTFELAGSRCKNSCAASALTRTNFVIRA